MNWTRKRSWSSWKLRHLSLTLPLWFSCCYHRFFAYFSISRGQLGLSVYFLFRNLEVLASGSCTTPWLTCRSKKPFNSVNIRIVSGCRPYRRMPRRSLPPQNRRSTSTSEPGTARRSRTAFAIIPLGAGPACLKIFGGVPCRGGSPY